MKPILHLDNDVTFDGKRVVGFWWQGSSNFRACGLRGDGLPDLEAHSKDGLREQIAKYWTQRQGAENADVQKKAGRDRGASVSSGN